MNNEPIWVDTVEQFSRMLDDLRRQVMIGVDTESNSLYVYHEQVCLIQFSTENRDYLVDPLVLGDISALESIFTDSHIEKVFHAAEYDLICLKRDFGFSFSRLFDTMVAGRILGISRVGLGSMLEDEFGILLDKRYQRANWGKRPLPKPMLDYAREDTHYLLQLRNRLSSRLESAGRLPLAEEDFIRLCDVELPDMENGSSIWRRVVGNKELTQRQIAVVQELCRQRDRWAMHADLPPFKILSNDVLLKIALYSPKTTEELGTIRGINSYALQRYGSTLLDIVRKAQKIRPEASPTWNRPDAATISRLEALYAWRKQMGLEWKVESDIILPRDVLGEIAESGCQTMDDLKKVMRTVPWRFDHFGAEICQILMGIKTSLMEMKS